MEKVIADNLARLMKHHGHVNPTHAGRELGVSQQQVDRLLKGQKARVDTVEKVARGYGLEPYQMMIPGLDPENPQVLRAVSAEERKLYEVFKEAVDASGKKGTQ